MLRRRWLIVCVLAAAPLAFGAPAQLIECLSNDDCSSDAHCVARRCERGEARALLCQTDEECGPRRRCARNLCTDTRGAPMLGTGTASNGDLGFDTQALSMPARRAAKREAEAATVASAKADRAAEAAEAKLASAKADRDTAAEERAASDVEKAERKAQTAATHAVERRAKAAAIEAAATSAALDAARVKRERADAAKLAAKSAAEQKRAATAALVAAAVEKRAARDAARADAKREVLAAAEAQRSARLAKAGNGSEAPGQERRLDKTTSKSPDETKRGDRVAQGSGSEPQGKGEREDRTESESAGETEAQRPVAVTDAHEAVAVAKAERESRAPIVVTMATDSETKPMLAVTAKRAPRVDAEAAEAPRKVKNASFGGMSECFSTDDPTQLARAAHYFISGHDELAMVPKRVLGYNARCLGTASDRLKVIVEAHTDMRGSTVSNKRLAERRGATVSAFLRSAGVSLPIAVDARGEEQPVCTTQTRSCHARNRRVLLRLETAEPPPIAGTR